MKKIKIDNIAKRIYQPLEMRFINTNGWSVCTDRMIPIGATWHNAFSDGRWHITEIVATTSQLAQLRISMQKKAKELRRKIPEDLVAYFKEIDENAKAKAKAERLHRAEIARIEKRIDRTLPFSTIKGVFYYIRRGENIGEIDAYESYHNGIECIEECERYSSSCRFLKTTRSFTLYLRKGWYIHIIGGVITFTKSAKIDRNGIVCEWVEQGKSIADIRTISGFLVRGEHIEAKSLKEAKRINEQHRAEILTRTLRQRKAKALREEKIPNIIITFADSLNSGNCRPGTQAFKNYVDRVKGEDVQSLNGAELRKLAKAYGCEYFAERAINYVLSK